MATATKKAKTDKSNATLVVQPPNLKVAQFRIRGIAPYVQNKFSEKTKEQMRKDHEAGSTARKGKKREGKDFQALYEAAIHRGPGGWYGMPASAFRNALVSACRLVGFHMTKAKISIFAVEDGFDPVDMTPLIKITKGEPKYFESMARNDNGSPDIRPRPMWEPGWEADVKIRFDADQFTLQDIANLLVRVGMQVGIGEGRPDSKNSCGMGWGLFEIVAQEEV